MGNLNKHILLVMKWLDDKGSVSKEDLKKNREAAADSAYADAAYASASAADADVYAADAAADAAYAAAADADEWVNRFFRRAGESKRDYTDAIEAGKAKAKEEPAQEWVGGLPPIGAECEVFISFGALQGDHGLSSDEIGLNGQKVTVLANVKSSLGCNVSVFEVESGVYCFSTELLKPLKTQEQKDREAFIDKANKATNADGKDHTIVDLFNDLFDAGFKAPEGE